MKKKKCAYVLAASQNIIFAAGNVALELNHFMPNEDFDILIYHSELQPNDIQALQKIKNVILKDFVIPKGFEEAIMEKMPPGRLKNKNALLTFAHYEIFNLLEQYKTAIWLDIDTAIQGDISGLQQYGPLGMAEDKHTCGVFTASVNFVRPVPRYNMNAKAYCTAVIVVSEELKNAKEIYDWCWDKSIQYASYLITPDQGIIQLALQHFNLPVNTFSWEKYEAFSTMPYAHLAKIAHFGTAQKIWNTSDLYQSYPQWQRTHLQYLSLGGSDFDRSFLNQNNVITTLRNYEEQIKKATEQPEKASKIRYYLFGIPVVSFKRQTNVTCIKILGVRLFSFKQKDNKRYYCFLGIPLLKIKINQKTI